MYSGKDNTKSVGLPHSDISGSKLILSSPKLFAEYHVFHRLLLPRHPPDALFYLILLCVCEILKNHIHLMGLLLHP